ncbi:MAG TPA: hypothetical protein VGO52_16225 [Hyphomonadaceae bacterium]|jgi:Ca2+-binding EF-hand superfamily protein|nr:hypothetical protein [Hyphomonadaceae bacterium]
MQDYSATPRKWRAYDQAAASVLDEAERLAAFKANDANNDGELDKAEYRNVLQARDYAEQLDNLLQQRDTNRDGLVSAGEYRAPIQ